MTYTPRTPKGRLATALCDTTRAMITAELEALRGNRSEAARRLGISRRALIYKMQELGIDIPASHGNGYTAAKRAVQVCEEKPNRFAINPGLILPCTVV